MAFAIVFNVSTRTCLHPCCAKEERRACATKGLLAAPFGRCFVCSGWSRFLTQYGWSTIRFYKKISLYTDYSIGLWDYSSGCFYSFSQAQFLPEVYNSLRSNEEPPENLSDAPAIAHLGGGRGGVSATFCETFPSDERLASEAVFYFRCSSGVPVGTFVHIVGVGKFGAFAYSVLCARRIFGEGDAPSA